MDLEICLNCFQDKGGYEVCMHCGFVEGTPPEQANHLFPGTVLSGRYVVGTVIDFGGFGVIYRAWDTRLSKLVAIKEFFPTGMVTREAGGTEVTAFASGDKGGLYQIALDRFLAEARTTVAFGDSPYIVNVYNYFEGNNTAYFVMEYLDGISLSDYLSQSSVGRLDYEEAFEIIASVMEGLKAIHAAGVIHRDIHPGNIFITTANQVKIIDFGAARLATGEADETRMVVATQGYTAPEQYRNKSRQESYTDIYGLGATLYRMLTGQVPEDAIDRQVKDSLVRPTQMNVLITPNAENAIMRAMAINPDLRYSQVSEFEEALLGGKKADDPETLLRRRMTRRAFLVGGVGLLAMGGVAAAVLWELYKPDPSLADRPIEDDELTLWLPVTGDEDGWQAQVEVWQQLADGFAERMAASDKNKNPRLSISVLPVAADGYAEELAAAVDSGTPPVLFRADLLDATLPEGLAMQLDELVAEMAEAGGYLFLDRYEELFPDKARMPLGFDTLALYGNEAMAAAANDGDGMSLPKTVPSLEVLHSSRLPVSVEASAYPLFLSLYHPGLADADGPDLTGDKTLADDLELVLELDIQDAEQTPVSLLAADEVLFMVGMTSDTRSVEEAAPGQYQMLSISNKETIAGRFMDVFAISAAASPNQQLAATLLLAHLLQTASQNLLYVQPSPLSSRALPIRANTFADFVAAHPGMTHLPGIDGRQGDMAFLDLDRPGLRRFSQDFIDQMVLAEGESGSMAEFLEQQ